MAPFACTMVHSATADCRAAWAFMSMPHALRPIILLRHPHLHPIPSHHPFPSSPRSIAEDANVNRYLLLLLWTFDLMQILAIPTSPTANLPWISMPIMRDYIFLVIEPAALLPGTDVPALGSTYNWIVIWLAVIVLTATYVACFAWLTYAHAGYSSYKPRWMVSFFRIAARVSLHGFYVPLTAMLTAPFSCYGDVWFHTTTRCWSGGHIGMVIITAILLPFCVGFNLTMAGTFIDRSEYLSYQRRAGTVAELLCHKPDAASILLSPSSFALLSISPHPLLQTPTPAARRTCWPYPTAGWTWPCRS